MYYVCFVLLYSILDKKTSEISYKLKCVLLWYLWMQTCCNCGRWQQPCLSKSRNSPHFPAIQKNKELRYIFIWEYVKVSNTNMKQWYQILPYATCPQLFHRGEPQVGQSSCHRNSILLPRPKQKISESMKSTDRWCEKKSQIMHISLLKSKQHR